MKKYSIIALFVTLVASLSSCNDDFMQRDPIDNMADGTFFTKEADLQLYLDGIYRYYVYGHGIGGTNNTSHDKGFLAVRAGSQIIFGDAFSDNTVYAGGIDSKLGGTYDTPNAASKNFDAPWRWEKLRKVNYFLNHYAEVGDPETLKKYAAQAYFFKAWDYYIKLVALGEVPWLEKELDTSSPELYGPRMPRTELVEKILECFDFAIQNLEDNDNSCGYINQDMALFLKSRFCLFEGTFRKYHTELNLQSTANGLLEMSRDAAWQIIEKNRYKLFKHATAKDSYWQLFVQKGSPETEGNEETILARVYDGVKLGHDNPRYWGKNNHTRYCLGATVAMLEDYLCADGRPVYIGGTEGNYEKNPLFKGYDGMWEELDNRDPRLTQTVCKPGEYASIFDADDNTYSLEESGVIYPMITYDTGGGSPMKQYNSTVTGYRFIKHWMPDYAEWEANANGVQTAHMFRYGELLLIYAEARAELGEITDDDLNLTINALRERAGYDFVKYPNAKLTLSNIPADPRLDAIYAQKLDYSVSPIIREIRRERRVEMMMEGMRYEDLMRWKAGKLFTVPARGMKMTPEKIELYSKNRSDEQYKNYPFKVTVPIGEVGNKVIVDDDGFIIPYPTSTTVIKGVQPWDDKRYYYPIPLNEMLMNPLLTQNPGWKDINR